MTDNQQENFYKILGARIKDVRSKTNLKQEAFATALGLSRASIVNIEKGRQRPPIHLLWIISNVLRIEVTDLIPNYSYASSTKDEQWENVLNQHKEVTPRLRGILKEIRPSKTNQV